jgi:hypothetical protein
MAYADKRDLAHFYCSCGNDWAVSDHEANCQLWNSVDFDMGYAEWNPSEQCLELIEDGLTEKLRVEHLGKLAKQVLGGLHEASDDEIGGPISDTVPLDDLEEDTPPSGHVISASQVAWSSMYAEDDGMAAYIEEAMDIWVTEGGDQPQNFSYMGVTWVWSDPHSMWEAKRLGCYCDQVVEERLTSESIATKYTCDNCGVFKYSKNGGWNQTITLKDEVTCECRPPKGWLCVACKVRRTQEWMPWEVDKFAGTTVTSQGTLYPKSGGAMSYTGGTQYVPKCRHYAQDVTFPSGTSVWASSSHQRKEGEALPDIGFYLDQIWRPQCLAFYINWADMGLPILEWSRVVDGIKAIWSMAQQGQQVEIGCIGGHGRTGTVLGCLAVLDGVPANEAVDWVHDNYCTEAIESKRQEWFIEWFDYFVRGEECPTPMPAQFTHGQAKDTRSKHKGKKVKIFADNEGTKYCGECQTDCKDQAGHPTHCHWCEGEFVYDSVEAKAPKALPTPSETKKGSTKSGGNGNSATKNGRSNPKVLPAALNEVSGEDLDRLLMAWAKGQLWPTERVKVFWAPDIMECNHCGDRISWRWGTDTTAAGWVHRTNPRLLVESCDRDAGVRRRRKVTTP